MLRTFGMMYACFRPLIGVIISNRYIVQLIVNTVCYRFRPLIGVIISNLVYLKPLMLTFNRFRPLIGVITSNRNVSS